MQSARLWSCVCLQPRRQTGTVLDPDVTRHVTTYNSERTHSLKDLRCSHGKWGVVCRCCVTRWALSTTEIRAPGSWGWQPRSTHGRLLTEEKSHSRTTTAPGACSGLEEQWKALSSCLPLLFHSSPHGLPSLCQPGAPPLNCSLDTQPGQPHDRTTSRHSEEATQLAFNRGVLMEGRQ